MPNGYSLIKRQYYLRDYQSWLELENDSFSDLKAYQVIAEGLGIRVDFNAETILDSYNLINGSGYMNKGKCLNICVPEDFASYFMSDVIRQLVK